MASEKPKREDRSPLTTSSPQNNELEPFYPQDGADDLAGIFYDMAQPAPFFPSRDMDGAPQYYTQEMSFPLIKDDVFHCPDSGLGYLNEPVSDLVANVNGFGQSHGLGDSLTAATIPANNLDNSPIDRNTVTAGTDGGGLLRMSKAGRDANSNDIYRPWLIENQAAGVAPLSGHNPTTGALGLDISSVCRSGLEARGNNAHMPWLHGNQFSHADSTPVSGHNPINEDLRMNNSFITGVAQSNHPATLDGNFLSLGNRVNRETGSNHNVSSKNSKQSTKKTVLPMFNTSSCQHVTKSSDCSCNVASGSFSFQKHAGGFTRLSQNEGDFVSIGQGQHGDGFSSLGEKGGVSHQAWNTIEFSSQVQNVGGFSSPVQNMGRSPSHAHNVNRSSGLVQNVGGLSRLPTNESGGTPLPVVDKQHFNHIPSSWKLGHEEQTKERFANIDPNTRFQCFPTGSLTAHKNSYQDGMPGAAWFRVTGLQSASSLTRSTTQPLFGQLQSPHIGAVRNFSPEPSVVSPIIGVTGHIPWQDHSGQPIQVNKVTAAQPLSSKNVRVQPANKGNFGQSLASVPVQPSRSMYAHAHTTGQEIQVVNGPTQSYNVVPGPSPKRDTPISPSNAKQTRRKKTRLTKPASHLSAPKLPRIGRPSSPVASIKSLSPTITQTVPSHLPFSCSFPQLSSLLRTSSLQHIKWQAEDKTPHPSGYQCHICKRDLSFTPEGPIYQPENPIPAAVLPCGHQFHDSCLKRITPENQVPDPPCIPCAIGEKD